MKMNKNKIFKIFEEIDNKDSPTKILKENDRVLLIDALNLFFRNFAVLNMVNEQGIHVGGLGGFLRSLGFLIKQFNPTSVYLVFDGIGGSTNRKNLNINYKSGRNINRITNFDTFENIDEENESKIDQISRLIYYLKCLPVKIITLPKVEADDVIAYLSKYLPENYNSKVYIVSSDQDYLQLVNDNVLLYRPTEKKLYSSKHVEQKYGIIPDNFVIYKSLLGDNSDSITGIKGMGPKKISKLFPVLSQKTQNLDDIFEISKNKINENIIYARILNDFNKLKENYLIMDLHKPLINDNEKKIINNIVEGEKFKLDQKSFVTLYQQDGLNNIIKNLSFWLKEVFLTLNTIKK
jgi:DNA polymerase-1